MTCDGTGRIPCQSCGGAGSHSSPHCPSLGLYAVYPCTTCKGKGRTLGKCDGCPACAMKAKGETSNQGSLFG